MATPSSLDYKPYLTNRNLFLFGLFILIIGIPTSKALMSIGQICLLGNWFIEGRWSEKGRSIKTSKLLWVLLSLFIIHLLGLFYTSDFKYAANDLRIKLPLLWLPLLFATTAPLSRKEFKGLLNFFVASVIVVTIISTVVWLGWTKKIVRDTRDISLFNSHIRFALMIVLSIIIFSIDLVENVWNKYGFIKVLTIFWLIAFLVILESLTGIIILSIVVVIWACYNGFKQKNIFIKYAPLMLILGGFIFAFQVVNDEYKKFQIRNPVNLTNLESTTMAGNLYTHDVSANSVENGNLVYVYINNEEMRSVWDKRSVLKYDSLNEKGQLTNITLMRYLTSKKLRKDSTGVMALTSSDIKLIAKGVSNYKYATVGNIRRRIHETMWEIDNYKNGGNPSGHSLTMRMEFWATGIQIIKDNFWLGVGTGDAQLGYNNQYKKSNSTLDQRWWLRSHNQFLAITVTFGVLGLLIFIVSLFWPIIVLPLRNEYYVWFFLIALFSMLNEDTLETQAGVTFFAFFNYFFLFQPAESKAGKKPPLQQ